MSTKPTILNKKTIATSRLFRIESLEIEFSNGVQRNYERLARGHSNGAVLVVPLLDAAKNVDIAQNPATDG